MPATMKTGSNDTYSVIRALDMSFYLFFFMLTNNFYQPCPESLITAPTNDPNVTLHTHVVAL